MKESLRSIKSKKISLKIVEQIRSLVESNYFRVGDKLPPEMLLAQKLGVSRPSVREALCALEVAGLVERKTGDGNYITDVSKITFKKSMDLLTRHSPRELMEVREIIEKEVIRKVAKDATEKDIDRIEKSLRKMKRAIQEDRSGIEEDIDFHFSMAQSLNNNLLKKLYKEILFLMHGALWKRVMLKEERSRHLEKLNVVLHQKILDGIRERNELKALEAWQDSNEPVKKYLYEDAPRND